MERLFKVLYFAAMAVEMLLRTPYALQRRRLEVVGRRATRTERGLLAGLTVAGLFLPLAFSLTSWLDFADYRLSSRAKTCAGGVGSLLLAASVWLFWRAHRDLGPNWSPTLEVYAQHTLTTRGVYGVIRHPMYASQWLWGLAQALLLPNWLAGPPGLLVAVLMYFIRVPEEERMLCDRFGDAYRTYCERTGRIVPRLHGRRGPAQAPGV